MYPLVERSLRIDVDPFGGGVQRTIGNQSYLHSGIELRDSWLQQYDKPALRCVPGPTFALSNAARKGLLTP